MTLTSTPKVHEVKGPGAVGSTPTLLPGESWSYESGTSITTPTGSVAGSFQFEVRRPTVGGEVVRATPCMLH